MQLPLSTTYDFLTHWNPRFSRWREQRLLDTCPSKWSRNRSEINRLSRETDLLTGSDIKLLYEKHRYLEWLNNFSDYHFIEWTMPAVMTWGEVTVTFNKYSNLLMEYLSLCPSTSTPTPAFCVVLDALS